MEILEKDLEKQLLELGKNLLSPPSSASELLDSLQRVENLLSGVEQSPSESMKEALVPSTKALIAKELLRHSDDDVKVAVASCISEITRITAPDAPYADDPMKEVFHLIVSTFEKLDEVSSSSYTRRTSILETVAKVRSCVVMLDLECDDLIVEMFRHFFRTIRDGHHEGVFSSMETIMTLVVEESEDISVDLLSPILNAVKKENKEVPSSACQLGEKVIVKCASKLKPYLLPAVVSTGASLEDYIKAVADACQAGDEAVETTDGDDSNKNSAVETDLVNAPPEKAVEVAMETLEDAPPSEEVGPSTVGSPKTVMSNGIEKKGTEGTPAANDSSKEADHSAKDEEAEPSKTIGDSVAEEEPPKSKSKPEKTNRRKGRKPNSSKSSVEPCVPLGSTRELDVVDAPEHLKNDDKDVEDIQSKDPADDTVEAAHNEKSSEVPVPSPKTSDSEHADTSSPTPTGSLADESRTKKSGREKKKEDRVEEDDSASDLDSRKEPDTKQNSDGATVSESTLNKHAGKKSCSASDQEESVPDSADDPMKEDDNLNELDGNPAKDLAQEAEVGSRQRVNKKKQGQAKATPAKGHTKAPAKDDKKKAVTLPKSTPKVIKDESDVDEASRSSSKRKRSGDGKAPQAKLSGQELVGAKVEVWWPDDKTFYSGVVKTYFPAKRVHKVFYDDGDVEVLNFKKEKWKLIEGPGEHASDGGSADDSADETPIGKKAKTSTDLGAKRGKSMSSTKTSGASSSKSKGTPKSASNRKEESKIAGKVKEEASKKVVKSDAERGGKSKASKAGTKVSDDTPKSSKKPKDDDVDTPKLSGKSKQDTSKGGAKSKGKSPKSVGKSNPSASGKAKASSSAMDEDTEDESVEPERTPEKVKGKSPTAPKSQKSSQKRKRSGKA